MKRAEAWNLQNPNHVRFDFDLANSVGVMSPNAD